ncbi:uncharacterized protein LOC144438426 [Glandiceps talaboti]
MGARSSKTSDDDSSKFLPRDGITLYDSGPSPCARRVRMILIEKGVPWHKVEVDLLTAEQKTPDYLKINPNGKVPALTVRNMEGVPNCSLYESNVITEFLDSVLPGIKLYPDDPWEKAQVQEWQEWEISLTDDFVPLMYANTFSFILRATHSSSESMLKDKRHCPQQLQDKYKKMYDGTYKTTEEMEQMAIGCYKTLLILEKALENKTYLVGDRFTIADLSVYPRVEMFSMLGLPIAKKHFPNISRYFANLFSRPCFGQSEDRKSKIARFSMTYLPRLLVTMGNWKSGKSHVRYDGNVVIDRVLADDILQSDQSNTDNIISSSEEYLVYDFPTSAECLQMKMMFATKGVKFASKSCDFVEMIGKPNGSGGLYRLQHKDRLVTGHRTILDYINNTTTGKSLYPSDPKLKADCQCWQAWDQTMNWLELSILVEQCMVSQKLHERFTADNIDELLSLKNDSKFSDKFIAIMTLYMSRVSKDSPLLEALSEYSHLIPNTEDSQKTIELHHDLLKTRLEYMETALQDKKYLVGDDLTVADLAVFSRLLLFPVVGVHISAENYPQVTAWMNTVRQHDGCQQEAIAFEKSLQKYQIHQ